jgi:hypothetical protein
MDTLLRAIYKEEKFMVRTTEKRMVEKDVSVYIALDGEKFDNERECSDYEKQRNNQANLKEQTFSILKVYLW